MITEEEAREAFAVLNRHVDNTTDEYHHAESTIIFWAEEQLASREAERAERESMLRGLLKLFDDADLERLNEVHERDNEAEKWKSENDMYGWNFHKGAAFGCTSASIIFFRVKREIKNHLDLLAAMKGGES